MNKFEDVIDMFLNLISEIKYTDYDLEELKLELGIKSKMVLAEVRVIKNVKFDSELQDFTRSLTDIEALIVANGLVVNWVSPKVNNFELFESQVSSKNFTIFSNSNLLSSLRGLRDECQAKLNSLVVDYDYDVTFSEDGDK